MKILCSSSTYNPFSAKPSRRRTEDVMFTFDPKLSTAIEAPPTKSQPAKESAAAPTGPRHADLVGKMQRYWSAANYLCVGQIYLLDNPLLREPLSKAHIKPRLLGHWGTSAGQNFIYVHLNRLIRDTDANVIYISGPGHGGPTLNACAFPVVLHAGRNSESLRTAHAEFDARGRGTRLFAGARFWRGFR